MKNVLVELLEVMSLTHHDWNLSRMIIFVKVSHNRTAQTFFGHLGEMRIPVLRRMGCCTPCSRKESHKIQTRVIVCVSDQGQCYGCGLSHGLYCRHCELPKARTGCLESAWHVMDATGNNNKKKKKDFLVFRMRQTSCQMCCGKCWPIELKYACIWCGIWKC